MYGPDWHIVDFSTPEYDCWKSVHVSRMEPWMWEQVNSKLRDDFERAGRNCDTINAELARIERGEKCDATTLWLPT